jgi:outer membrane receptor protein involved in Fe transport
VSTNDGPLNWIGGVFYNKYEYVNESREFTPEFSEYLGGDIRPDDLEYYAVTDYELVESAVYGEVSYDITERWQVTAGARYYDYELDSPVAVDFPLILTSLGEYGPDEINLEYVSAGQKDSGSLFKFNTSYDFTDDVMGYVTVSEGYRIGNSNGYELCDDDPNTSQSSCAQPREFEYFPDSTTNYEVGMRSQWFERRLTVNAAVYFIDWKDIQLTTATLVGAGPITINGEGAKSQGLELSFNALLTDALSIEGSYGYVNAELTEDAPGVIRFIEPPGFDPVYGDAFDGDRLPGSPEHQGSLAVTYTLPMGSNDVVLNYGMTAIGDVLTRIGNRGGGETLPGFALHSASVAFKTQAWGVTLYAKNLFNKYAVTGVRGTRDYIQTLPNENGEEVFARYYAQDIVRPREVGLRFNYDFSL